MKKTPLPLTLIALLLLCAMTLAMVGCGANPVTESTDAVTLNPDTEAESGNGDTDSESVSSVSSALQSSSDSSDKDTDAAADTNFVTDSSKTTHKVSQETDTEGESSENSVSSDETPEVFVWEDPSGGRNVILTDFAVRLFQSCMKRDENTVISPLSVYSALAMTANGAEGETRTQMESVLGMTVAEMNAYLSDYRSNLPQGEKYKLSMANSIWFKEDPSFTVNQAFLQTGKDYFGADVYLKPFNDQTLKEINDWVKEKTDGMIPQILNELPDTTVMSLINALAFDAEWEDVYLESKVRDGTFTKEDGTQQTVEFMYGSERSKNKSYLEDETAVGFVKKYNGGRYAFAAILPKEGISLSDYVASLDGESLYSLLSTRQKVKVFTLIPKFESEYGEDLAETLKNMGMPLAFDFLQADFDGLGSHSDGPLYIGRVLHKTFISVGERGTKAGAATVIDVPIGSAPPGPEPEPKEVYLDRPFLYLLIDCKNRVPIFMGTVTDLAE